MNRQPEQGTFDWAVNLYAEYLESIGAIYAQPSSSSECIDGVWHLFNGNGDLAKVYPDGRVEPADEDDSEPEQGTFDWAVKLYAEHLASIGAIFTQPSSSSECIDGVWHLFNGNGNLAKVFPDGRVEPTAK